MILCDVSTLVSAGMTESPHHARCRTALQHLMAGSEPFAISEIIHHEGQIAAISKAQAVIEFDLSGAVLAANENFLRVMGYSLEEVTLPIRVAKAQPRHPCRARCGNQESIGITAGEQMPNRKDYSKEQWLWQTYGEGIRDGLKDTPDRKFRLIHRFHMTGLSDIQTAFAELPCPLDLSFKYAIAHMYSVPNPSMIKPVLPLLSPKLRSWLTIRNDDIHSFRWADVDYARAFIKAIPGEDKIAGFYMGPDGYHWGRDFITKDPGGPRPTVMQKQWLSFALWGRLAYEPDLPATTFERLTVGTGPTDLAVSDDQLARFSASRWSVTRVNGHDPEAVAAAIEAARKSAMKANKGKYVLVVEGAIPVKDDGIYCKIGGRTALEILNILAAFPSGQVRCDDAGGLHLRAEAVRCAFQDRLAYLGDPERVVQAAPRCLEAALEQRQLAQVRQGQGRTRAGIRR